MEVFLSSIRGAWKREDNGSVYNFWSDAEVEIASKYSMRYSIETVNRESWLILAGLKFKFVVAAPNYFILSVKGGTVRFDRV